MTALLQNKRFLFIVFGLFLFNVFMFNEALWDEDEAAYAGFAQQMNETGNWTIPNFPWSDIHRKTPLHFWSIAVAFKLFGTNEFALRLPGVLAILATLSGMFFLGRRVFGQQTALVATLILASSWFIPNFAKIGLTDHGLLLWETLAILALLNFLHKPHWAWNALLWGSVSMGLLVKGPPILILVGGLWIWTAIFHPQRRLLLKTHPWFFGPLALLPLAAWLWMAWQVDGGTFVTFLWEWYVTKRVGGSVLGQTGWPGYHLGILLLAFLPWMTYVASSLASGIRLFRQRDGIAVVLMGWLLFGWVFYEFMASKLPSYSMAAQPALAFLLARQVLASERKDYTYANWDKVSAVFFLLLAFALSAAVMFAMFFFKAINPAAENGMIVKAIPAASLLWVTSVAAVVGVFMDTEVRHRIAHGAMVTCGIGFTFLVWLTIMPVLDRTPLKATRRVVSVAETQRNSTTPIWVYLPDGNMRQPSLAFYVYARFPERTVLLDADALKARFVGSSPLLVITDEASKNMLEEIYKMQGRQFSFAESVLWWDTDHELDKKYFWVLKN